MEALGTHGRATTDRLGGSFLRSVGSSLSKSAHISQSQSTLTDPATRRSTAEDRGSMIGSSVRPDATSASGEALLPDGDTSRPPPIRLL
ncbi:unnamed protein product, partial [Amoebophrya sp. A120]|eukprot:GSA120T00005180001.1